MSLSKPQKPLILFLSVAGISLLVGWGVGKILVARRATLLPQVPTSQVPEEHKNAEKSGNDAGDSEEETPSDWESFTGTIIPLDVSIYMQGSHMLVDENGEIILLLEARDDKLEVALGMEAEVQGPVENTVEGNQRIMTVEKIVFR